MKMVALPVLTILFGLVLFPNLAIQGIAAAETPAPTATPSASNPPSPEPSPTLTRMPPVSNFNRELFSIADAASLWVVVNKKTPLNPIDYRPSHLMRPKFQSSASNPYRLRLARLAANALVRMANAMKAAGAGTLVLQSGYRSYSTQVTVHERAVARYGKTKGEDLAARPGYSEHQTGLAADLTVVGQGCTIRVCFANTKAGKWLAANSVNFGFILRYPDNKTAVTGYQYEPWHFRYVGVDLAQEMRFEHVRVLESFWGLPAAPNY